MKKAIVFSILCVAMTWPPPHHRTPTPTPSISPSPTATVTPSPSVTASPSPSATPISKTPHGLYEIGGDALANPNISGYRAELKWSQSEPSDGTFDFSKIDGLVTSAGKAGRQISCTLIMLSQPPTWLITGPSAAKTYLSPLGPDNMVLPSDPAVQPKMIAYIKAFCIHFDGKLDYVVMGGLGYKTETYMPLPGDIGLTTSIADFISEWQAACNTIVDSYASSLKQTLFLVAAGIPFKDPGGIGAIGAVVGHGLTYPLFGIMQWGLNPNSNDGFPINLWIENNSPTHVVGFQDGSGGRGNSNLDGTLAAALILKAHFVELYYKDCTNPDNTATLAKYNPLFK